MTIHFKFEMNKKSLLGGVATIIIIVISIIILTAVTSASKSQEQSFIWEHEYVSVDNFLKFISSDPVLKDVNIFKSLTAIEISKKWDSAGNIIYLAKTTPEFMWGCNLYMILTDDNEITGIVNTGLGGNNDLFSYDIVSMSQGDFIAVCRSSHVGNGMLVLLPISEPTKPKYGIPDAVDGDYEDMRLTAVQYGLASENDKNVTASAIYLGGKLHADYFDIDNDGNTDVILTGIKQIYETGRNFQEQILRKEFYVKNVYLYNPMKDDSIFSDEMSEQILINSY